MNKVFTTALDYLSAAAGKALPAFQSTWDKVKAFIVSLPSIARGIPAALKTGIEHTNFKSEDFILQAILLYGLSVAVYMLLCFGARRLKRNYKSKIDCIPASEDYMDTDKYIVNGRGEVVLNPQWSEKESKKALTEKHNVKFLSPVGKLYIALFCGKLKIIGFLIFFTWLVYITAHYELRDAFVAVVKSGY